MTIKSSIRELCTFYKSGVYALQSSVSYPGGLTVFFEWYGWNIVAPPGNQAENGEDNVSL